MPADVLRLRNMRFFAHHGLYPEENRLGQRYEVDVDLIGDLAAAGRTADVTLTVNYPKVYELVERTVCGTQYKLVEALAEGVAAAIGARFAPIELVVRVRKPDPPVAAQFDGVEVEIHRTYG